MEFKLYMRIPVAVFFGIAFPVLLLGIFGSIFGEMPLSINSDFRVIDYYVPALIGAYVAQGGLVGLSVFLSNYREIGILKRLHATPISLETYLFVHTGVQFGTLLISWTLMILLGIVMFGIHAPVNPAGVCLAILVSVCSFFAMGFALGGLIKTSQTIQAVANFLFLSMFFLSGAIFPLEGFPEWLQLPVKLLPLTHVVQAVTGYWLGDGFAEHTTSLLILLGFMGVSLVVARKTFSWTD